MTGTALFPWESPLSSSDGLTEGTTVQVVSCASVVQNALKTKKPKDVKKWLGQEVTIVEAKPNGAEVKCRLKETKSEKAETIWLVPGALTRSVKSMEELVRHTLHGIYHAAYRKMEKDSMEVAVHALCKGASSDGDSLFCIGNFGDEVHELTRASRGHFHGRLRVKQDETGEVKLKFMLKKSESILQRGAGIMRDLFGGSSTDVHMEEEEVKLTPTKGLVVCQLFEKSKVEPLDGFLAALHQDLANDPRREGAADAEALRECITVFDAICGELQKTPVIKEYKKLLSQPMSCLQGYFAIYVLGRLFGPPNPKTDYFPGCLVLVERPRSKKKGIGSCSYTCEVLKELSQKLKVRRLDSTEEGSREEEVDIKNATPISKAQDLDEVMKDVQEHVLRALALGELRDLYEDESGHGLHGLQALLSSNAAQGSALWIKVVRNFACQLVDQTLVLNFTELLEPVSFKVPSIGDAHLKEALHDLRPALEKMQEEVRDTIFKVLLGGKNRIEDLVSVLFAAEGTPQRTGVGGLAAGFFGIGADREDDSKALVHNILGSVAFELYHKQMIQNAQKDTKPKPSRLMEIFALFKKASFLKVELQNTWQQLFSVEISHKAWLEQVETVEAVGKSYALLLKESEEDKDMLPMLKRNLVLLLKACIDQEPKLNIQEAFQKLLKHLSPFITKLMEEAEVKAMISAYIWQRSRHLASVSAPGSPQVRRVLCVLSAGGELSSMLPTGKLIGEMVKDACKEPSLQVLLETLQFLGIGKPITNISQDMCTLLVEMIGRQAPAAGDSATFLKSVKTILTAVMNRTEERYERAVDEVLVALLTKAGMDTLDIYGLIEPSGEPWRLLLKARDSLGHGARQQMERLFEVSHEYLTALLEGELTLEEAEGILVASKELLEAMAQYLVDDDETFNYPKLSEIDASRWAEAVVTSLQEKVTKYNDEADRARAFLNLCTQCKLSDASKVSKAALAVLQHDKQLALRDLPNPQDRWWFCSNKAVKELQNCAVFQSVVVEWANSAGLSNSDAFEGDALDEDEEILINDSIQEHEQTLKGCNGRSASYLFHRTFKLLFDQFVGLCKILEGSKAQELDFQTVKSIISLEADVKEQLKSAQEASGLKFPEATEKAIQLAARIKNVARDLEAVSAAAALYSGTSSMPFFFECKCKIENLLNQSSEVPVLAKKDVDRHRVFASHTFRVCHVATAVADADRHVLAKLETANCLPIVRALAGAKELYDFLKNLLHEDLLPLQESIESYSDELLRSDTIFALLDVQRFFRVLTRKALKSRSFDAALMDCMLELKDIRDLAGKLETCIQHSHGLQNLYRNLSKREEVAAEKIRSAIKEGSFKVVCNAEALEISLSYTRRVQGNLKTLSKQDLIDLRARAMLNPEESSKTSKDERKIMMRFSEQVDVLLRACNSLETLREEGFYWARQQKYEVSNGSGRDALVELHNLERSFQDDLTEWREKLQDVRAKYPELSFVYSKQFWLLADFLQARQMEDCDSQMVLSILSHIQGKALSQWQRDATLTLRMSFAVVSPLPGRSESLQKWFEMLGKRLVSVLSQVTYLPRSELGGKGLSFNALELEMGLNSVVEKGKVRSVHARCKAEVLRMALSFYGGARCLPRAHEMLFCAPNTSWPQMDAFLSRCRHVQGLYCILHVERLTYKLQHRLVERIHSGQLGSSYRLVLVAMCESDDVSKVHTLTEIPAKPAHALSPQGLQRFVQHLAPELVCVLSDDAGCGKTETVRQRAFALKKVPQTVPLSGPLNVSNFIQRLLMRKWRSHDCLHLDIGPTKELDLLDDILVQISFWGVVQAESKLAMVPRDYTFVELANVSTGVLRNLTISSLVSPTIAKFDVSTFLVSPQPRSPAQVVCKVLEAFENQSLQSRPVTLDGEALREERCRELLRRYIVNQIQGPPSYALVHTVLRVLAVQFISFSNSAYFDPKQLKDLKLPTTLRLELVQSLLEACLDFTTRAVTASKMRQRNQHDSGGTEVDLEEGMIRWSETKPLLLFNRFDRQTLSLVYREEGKVPEKVKDLFRSQLVGTTGRPPNYQSMSTKDLEERLGRIILELGKELGKPAEGSSYVLSPDNFIKMIWIALRVESKVPVIIMGETGCGKTSLIRHLAKLLSVNFKCLNVHAGTSAEDIMAFVEGASSSNGAATWAFLDEVNTCDHMGLVTEILCHRRVLGKPLPENLVLLAACNPYRLKKKLTSEAQQAQAQLSLGDTSKRRKMSSLVYSVQELPEALYDYLYDFGFLGKKEEESYVKAMVEPIFQVDPIFQTAYFVRSVWPKCVQDLIHFSQTFTAENQPDCLLSLRDVKRCVELIKWFQESLRLRQQALLKNQGRSYREERLTEEDMTLRSVLNALAISYHCRLPDRRLRNAYRAQIAQILIHHRVSLPRESRQSEWKDQDIINWLLNNEKTMWVRHMTLPDMTATNEALVENIFTMMVCILNRIPIFAIGKPGNSKSLALRILNSNLRGPDSEKELWRNYPRVYVISYQGSEVSTSEGITKVFERARTYKNSIANDALVLVHFDEIGLAEASPNNPLKVLHAHLEPGYPKDRPDYAVVGLSNFPLDAAKMNRAIALVRPPPPKEDLVKTAKAIICQGTQIAREDGLLKVLAEQYNIYYQNQPVADFHGLRDFYALVKTLAYTYRHSPQQRNAAVYRAIARNFGGLKPKSNTGQTFYRTSNVRHCHFWEMQGRFLGIKYDPNMQMDVVEMLEENLRDKTGRHLMLVCSGEVNVPLTLVQTAAQKEGRSVQIMMGSTFAEDQSDHYSFGLLKRVVLSMERGDILVMRALDSIHGSLYDMLNMSYTTFGDKRHCRIALGDTDIFAQVHENFRCVVLQDEALLPTADAAFLNRFEKHYVSIKDMVTNPIHSQAVHMLENWIGQATSGPKLAQMPDPQSLFMGWGPETAASLIKHIVLRSNEEAHDNAERLANEAWKELAPVASVDGMLRATQLSQWSQYEEPAQEWHAQFFAQPQSLQEWLVSNNWQSPPDSKAGPRFGVVLTTSPIQVDLAKVLDGHVPAYERVAVDALTSELDLSHRLEEFNDASLPPGAVLVLQLRADSPHVELLRHRCHELKKKYRALVLLHGSRRLMSSTGSMRLRLNFQTGWAQVFLERLIQECSLDVKQCVELELEDLMKVDGPMPFQTVLKGVLSECFWYIKYPATKAAAEHVEEVTKLVLNDQGLLDMLQEICLEKIRSRGNHGVWWHKVIRDMRQMPGHSSFADCIEAHIRQLVRQPAAVLVYLLEKSCALYTLQLYPTESPMRDAWFRLCRQRVLPQLGNLPLPTGPEQYPYPQHLQHLRVPFSAYFAEELDSFRSTFFEHKLHQVQSTDARVKDLTLAMEAAIPPQWRKMLKEHQAHYAEDLAALRLTAVPLPQDQQRKFLQPIMKNRVMQGGIAELHQFLWRHQGTLQLALRQLAAIPSELRNLDGLLAMAFPRGMDQLRPENMARMMSVITSHACGALHPTSPTLTEVGVDWLLAATRVLSAAKSCLEHISREERVPLVELSALSVMIELSQKMERINLPVFWAKMDIGGPISRPEQLCKLVEDVLKAAEPHMSSGALQRFQRFAHQQLLEHGVSEGILKSVSAGRPAVATAMLLRELVQSAVLQDPLCFLKYLQTSRPCSVCDSNNALRALDKLAKEAKVKDPLCAVMCVELQEYGFPALDGSSSNSFFSSDAVTRGVEVLTSALKPTQPFGLAPIIAAAVLRLVACQAAKAITKQGDDLDDVEDVLAEACSHAGTDPAGFVASLLRGTVLREVHARLTPDDATNQLVEHCRDIEWLALSLPLPGNAPLLKGSTVPLFLGGFMPEAVEAAKVLSTAAALKVDKLEFLELIEKAGTNGPWRFAFFCASSALLCSSGTPQDNPRDARDAARSWLSEHPRLQGLPALLRAKADALPAELQRQLEVAPMQMLTALHLAAALLASPSSGFSAPFKRVALGRCEGFLPAMPDDEEEEILRALHGGNAGGHHGRGHTRYQCQCGYKYIVADCGHAVQEGRCPSCHRTIGGTEYAHRQNRRLDQQPQLGGNQGQQGYFEHGPSTDRRQSVRQLTPLAYRALHFLLHSALLGPCFQAAVPQPSLRSILQHLTADWQILQELLEGCSPAGVLMDLAGQLLFASDASAHDVLKHAERRDWERKLAEAVVMPCMDPSRRADFDAKLDWSSSLGSIKEALPLLLADRLPPMGTVTSAVEEEASCDELPELLTKTGRFLELGCGNLSFARSFMDRRSGRHAHVHLTTTMLEDWDVVRARYENSNDHRPSAESHRQVLEARGATVLDQVDGTKLTQKFPLGTEGFDHCIFNFPYGGTFLDNVGCMPPHTRLGEHTTLLDGVFQSAKEILNPDGCIWITFVCSQIETWQVEVFAKRRGLVLVKKEAFPWMHFPGYHPVWGDDRDFERTQPRQCYTGRSAAVLCCFKAATAGGRRADKNTSARQSVPEDEEMDRKVACSRLLRLVEKPTLSRLEREFLGGAASHGPAAQHPLLRCVLEASDQLHLVAHLANVLEWQRFVRRHFEFELSRAEATTLKVREAFSTLERNERSGDDVMQGRRLFEKFQEAWNECRGNGCMNRYGCQELRDAPRMSLESPLGLSCADENTVDNTYIVALQQSLVDKQNHFLEEVLEIARQQEHAAAAAAVRSVLEYWFHPGQVSLPVVGIEHVNETHLLIQSTQENGLAWMTRMGSAGALAAWEEMNGDAPELIAPGNRCVFDWELLEQETAERLLQKAVFIDFKPQAFPFRGEAFLNDYDFLGEVCMRVKQEVSPEPARNLLMCSVKAAELMASLQAAIAVVRRLAPSPDLSIRDFCARWLNASLLHSLMQHPECQDLKVTHIVHLFEVVEMQAAKDVLQEEAVPPQYCKEWKDPFKHWQGSVAMRAQEIMLRIMIRWLSPHGQPKPEDVVTHYAERALRQVPPDDHPDVAELFQGLTLANIRHALHVADKAQARGQ